MEKHRALQTSCCCDGGESNSFLILAAAAFYPDRPDLYDSLADYGVLAVEMESAAIYTIAARYRAKALTILTVSDHIKRGEKLESHEREQGFGRMVEIGLDTAVA